MCVSGCSCSDIRLEMLLFGVSHGVLHEGLVGVEAPDVTPPTMKSSSVMSVPDDVVCGVHLILIITRLGYRLCQINRD
ncbi:hypothetical protein BHE74_00046179 [Ensete ventricosum]|nr:hypothetical protein BHE74_00046179 [Ensete ventricosum]